MLTSILLSTLLLLLFYILFLNNITLGMTLRQTTFALFIWLGLQKYHEPK
jgi:hypothetical protein